MGGTQPLCGSVEQTYMPDNDRHVRLRVIDEMLSIEDVEGAVQRGEDEWVVPYEPRVEQWESAEMVEVLDWDFEEDNELSLEGPPEVLDDGSMKYAVPDEYGEVHVVAMARFKCLRCGEITNTEVRNGELEEPHKCAGCERQGPWDLYASTLLPDDSPYETPPVPDPIWDPPSGLEEASMEVVWNEIRGFLSTNWHSGGRPYLYDGLTAWAISTWFRPAWHAVPHLMVIGKTESGKTHLLNALKRVSYRSFLTASSTEAHIFRSIDGYNVTYFFSEYHDVPEDARDGIDAVIKAGQKRGEKVGRSATKTGGGAWEAETFDPFTHIAIGTQYEPREDIVNRCIAVQSISSSEAVPFEMEVTNDLLNRLLWLRYRYLGSDELQQAYEESVTELWEEYGIKGRLREKMVPLLSVAKLANQDISEFIRKMYEASKEDDAESEDALVVKVMLDIAMDQIEGDRQQAQLSEDADPWDTVKIQYDSITEAYEDMTGVEMSPSKLGHIIKRLGFEKGRSRDGTYVDDPDLEGKLKGLADDLGLEWGQQDGEPPVKMVDDPRNGICPLCGETRELTHRASDTGRMCGECAEDEKARREMA